MDLLIKGMDMPRGCNDCIFCNSGDELSDNWYCEALHGERLNEENKTGIRRADCPLVEIPEHDDLISRRDVIEVVYGYHINNHPMKEIELLPATIPASKGWENKPFYSDESYKGYNMWDGE